MTVLSPGRVRQLFAVAGLLAIASPALAQRPVAERQREVLGVQFIVSGSSTQQGEDTPAEIISDIPQLSSTYYGDVSGVLRYNPHPVGSATFSVTASSAIRRYERGSEFMVVGHSIGGGVGWVPSDRTALYSSGYFSYIPSYALNTTIPGDAAALVTSAGTLPLSALDFSLTKRTSLASSGSFGMTQNLTRRMALSFSYMTGVQEFASSEDPSFLMHTMSGRLSYSLTRGVALRLGYGRRIGDFQTVAGNERVTMDDIDAGLSFSQAIGITNTTRLSFDSGSTIQSIEGRRQASLTGNAALNQDLGRRGRITLAFSRGSDLRPGFRGPIFSNTASLSGNYSITRPLVFSAYATAFLGENRRQSTDNDIESVSGAARLAYMLFRGGQVYGEYLVFRNRIDSGVDLLATVSRNQSSRTIRAGFAYSIPLVTSLPPRGGSRPTPIRGERN